MSTPPDQIVCKCIDHIPALQRNNPLDFNDKLYKKKQPKNS